MPSATPARCVMPTIELSEKPRSPNSSRAASRILRKRPLATRRTRRLRAGAPTRLFFHLHPHPAPPTAAACISQVETRFMFQYDMNPTADATRVRKGEKIKCASFLHAPLCSAPSPPRRFSQLRPLPQPRTNRGTEPSAAEQCADAGAGRDGKRPGDRRHRAAPQRAAAQRAGRGHRLFGRAARPPGRARHHRHRRHHAERHAGSLAAAPIAR